jgi:hypothetical protein
VAIPAAGGGDEIGIGWVATGHDGCVPLVRRAAVQVTRTLTLTLCARPYRRSRWTGCASVACT